MRKCLLFSCCLLLLTVLGEKVLSQETTADIQGIVSDSATGLPGATVTATHQPTGSIYNTTTRKDGHYTLANLRVGGPYLIKVSFVGYAEEQRDNISLDLGQAFKADFTMKPSTTELTEVTIAGRRSDKIFNTSHTGSQEVIGRSQIERLPTINRSLQDFTKLEPTANGLNIGGRSNQYNNVTVDGANFNNSFGLSSVLGGQTNSQPISIEAVEQIQVNVSPYDVTQGGFSGTGINSVTKSGTNQFRGSVYTVLKGPGTQGYDVGTTKVVKSDFSFNTRGFTIGGPIVRDKLFFFLSAEQVRQTAPATSFQASDAAQAPGSGNVSVANADTLNQLADFLKSKFNYDPGAYQNYSFTTKSDKITAKLDWNISNSSTLTLKYNYLKSSADQFASSSRNIGQITGGQPGTLSMPFYSSGYQINNNFNIVIAELNTRIGNRASNKLQVGYTALRDFRAPHSGTSFPLVDILNNNNIYTTFGYETYTYNNLLNTDVYQFADIFKLYKGAHELTFGTQDYYRKYKNAFAPSYQGVYQFNSLSDFYASAADGTTQSKNYFLQYSALKDGSFPFAFAGSTELGLFIQDKWRVRDNFTLTYGVRGDLTIYNQTFTDNPSFDALTFKNGTTYNIGKAPKTVPLISPRVGFNWTLLGDRSLQIRGGAGIFSGPPPFVWISNQASNNGIQFGQLNSPQAFSQDVNAYRPAGGAPASTYGVALVASNFKYPQVMKSSLAFDKKLAHDFVVTLEASYSKDLNSVYYSNVNLNQENGFALEGADNRTRYLTSVANSNKYYSGTTLDNPNLTSAILMSNSKKGYSYTVTGRIQKTFRNFFTSVAYTYSDARNVAEGGSTASTLWSARAVSGDPNNANLAYASYFQPHRVIAYASYRFEYGKHFATSIGAIYEASPTGIVNGFASSVASYVYNGDLNGDGNNANDLIYIPRSADEINLVKSGSGGDGTGNSTDPRSGTIGTDAASAPKSSQIWNQLNAFINQDHYLSKHRGEYAKANAVIMPWVKKLDLNVTQDIYFNSGKTKHTLRLTVDLINAGNLVNKFWGTAKTPNLTNFLKYEGLAADGLTPSFSFTYQDAVNQTPLVNSFRDDTSIFSRWQMQFGIRYPFN